MVTLPPRLVRGAWETGELGYRFRNVQRVARESWEKVQVKFLKFYLECNRRFGKSAWGLFWLSEDAIKNPGAMEAFFAPVKEGLRDYIVPIIDEVFKDCPNDLKPILDAHMTLTFPNGSMIIFRGSNNQQHRVRRGNAFRRVYIDEGRDVDDLKTLVESVVVPSLFSVNGRVVLGSTPADTEDHDLSEIKQQAEQEGWYHHCDIYECSKHDPSDFPPERIEQWKKETSDPVAWAREYLAQWVKDPTKIIIPEWKDECAIETSTLRDQYFQFYHKYTSMDLGVVDKTAGLFGYYDFKRAKLIIEDEFAMQDAEVRTDRIAEAVKSKELALGYQMLHDRKDPDYAQLQQHEKMRRRISDNNNLLLVNDLNSLYQLDFIPTTKDELVAMINAVRELVKDSRILVDIRCKELLGCLRNATWDKHKKDLAKSKVFGHFDALMALVYLVRNIDFSTNPVPKYFGMSWATHPGIPADANIPNTGAWQLAQALKVKTSHDVARSDFARGKF